MTDEPEFTLSERPELAQAVGGLIMSVAQIEATFLGVLATQLGRGPQVAAIIFESIDNVGARLDIITGLARQKPALPVSVVLLEREAEIRAAIRKRNELAHSMFGYTEDGEVVLMTGYLSARRGKPRKSELVVEEINKHIQSLSNASVFLSLHLDETDLTPRHRMDHPGRVAE